MIHRSPSRFDDDGDIVGFRDHFVANVGALDAQRPDGAWRS